MPALMDSAVLLAADGLSPAPFAPVGCGMECDMLTRGSGAFDDWQAAVTVAQVLTPAEILTALPPGMAAPANGGGNSAGPPPTLPLSPSKPRQARSRRGKPKSGGVSPDAGPPVTSADADADANTESPPTEASPPAPGTKAASPLPCGTARVGKTVCVWNPFSGLKLMGARHKAEAHILDLAPPLLSADPAPTVMASAAAAPPAETVPIAAAQSTPPALPVPSGTAAAMQPADSIPDLDAFMDNTVAGASPDYDTAKECGGLGGSKHGGAKFSAATKGVALDGSDDSVGGCGGADTTGCTRKVPAAAADYALPRKGSQKRKKGKKAKHGR